MHDIAVVWISPENIGNNLTESPGIESLVDILDGVVHVFLGRGNASGHIALIHIINVYRISFVFPADA